MFKYEASWLAEQVKTDADDKAVCWQNDFSMCVADPTDPDPISEKETKKNVKHGNSSQPDSISHSTCS